MGKDSHEPQNAGGEDGSTFYSAKEIIIIPAHCVMLITRTQTAAFHGPFALPGGARVVNQLNFLALSGLPKYEDFSVKIGKVPGKPRQVDHLK